MDVDHFIGSLAFRPWKNRILNMSLPSCLLIYFLAFGWGPLTLCSQVVAKDELDDRQVIVFNRDIRPLLSDRCFQCHGPDEKKREADLRFDLEKEAKKDLGGYRAVVEGDLDHSELVKRITTSDDDQRMPPPESGKSLSEDEKKLLRRWIKQGAAFEKHWSFQGIRKSQPPKINLDGWPQNEIDLFVGAKLRERGLVPSPRASSATLIRRLYIDLIGLAPTVEEVNRFSGDPSPEAYERVVDRLLASRHYGERMGRHWLDLARYADSNGYANDGLRSIWPYRDWVIQSLNDDMPFDQFTIEQLAGDLLPNATPSQLVATGFHRNTPLQTEGGSDPEQYRVERTKNRTDTTGAVWLGLTVGCAQCHTHKFDPITHREYYQLYSFFNSADEPTLTIEPRGEVSARIAGKKRELQTVLAEIEKVKTASVEEKSKEKELIWKGLALQEMESLGGASLKRLPDSSILVSGKNPPQDTYRFTINLVEPVRSIRIETLTHPSLPKGGPGRAGNGNFVLAELKIQQNGKNVEVVGGRADHSQQGYSVVDAFDGDLETGWAINIAGGKLNVDRTAEFVMARSLSGLISLSLTTYEQGSGYNIGRLRLAGSSGIASQVVPGLSQLVTRKNQIEKEMRQLEKTTSKTLILRERSKPRESFVQLRGDFLDRGPVVIARTFDVLPKATKEGDAERPANRLDLARWLTSSNNPLTARVHANRIWQHLFGVGLVETENDFGYQGELPSHPDLLDFLASDLVEHRWRQKRLYKKIVMSATYQQSSVFRADLSAVDPKNRWVGRQNRYRVEGEIVRDLALTASGLLSRKMGGPPVFPPIPPNVIGTSSANHRWPTSQGEDRYRRGVYTAIYRANVYPMLLAFDGPDRDNACTRRSVSNTPLQALTMANDAGFMEMSQALGARINGLVGKQPDDLIDSVAAKIDFGVKAALSRLPTSAEQEMLAEYFKSRVVYYRQDSGQTKMLVGKNDPVLAAWVAVGRVLLNLDEMITRE
jgi:hypothetical protein